MKTIIRAMGIFALLMTFSLSAYAASSGHIYDGEDSAQSFFSSVMNKSYDENDLAHKSLARLFGGFIFEPFGDAPDIEPTLLTHVLGYTNLIAMILGIAILVYVILNGAIKTAADGEMLGKGWSSVWLPMRTAMAFGLIMPSGAGLLSAGQLLIMYLIIIGSNSASWIWEKGAENIIGGAPVMASTVYYDANSFLPIANLVHCSAVNNKMTNDKDETIPYVATATLRNGDQLDYIYNDLGKMDFEKTARIDFKRCGHFVVPSSEALEGTQYENIRLGGYSASDGKWENEVQIKFNQAVKEELAPVFSAAIDYADYMIKEDFNENKIQAALSAGGTEARKMGIEILAAAKELGKVDTAYDSYIAAVREKSVGDDIEEKWKDSMTKGGWMKAGVWFFEASRYQGFIQTLMTKLSTNSEFKPDEEYSRFCSFSLWGGCKDRNEGWANAIAGPGTVSAAYRALMTAQSSIEGGSGVSKMMITAPNSSGEKSSFSPNILSTLSVSVSQVFLDGLMRMGADDALGTGGSVAETSATNVSGMLSPFTAVSAIGRGIQQITTTVWVAGVGVSAAVGAFDSTGSIGGLATGGVGGAISGVAKYLISSLWPIFAGMFSLAFMLAFAIPFMPIIIWIMLVCGYLVTVVEAIAAAPLAIIMMSTPEGEGVAGSNFQKALQMINAIILRPSLSVVGLFAAMSLGYVAFAVLNELFWAAASFTTSGSLFEIAAIIITYTLLAFKVCEYVFSIIHKLPDQIMEWMGAGMSRAFGEQAAEESVTGTLKGGTAGAGMAVGGGVAAAMGSNKRKGGGSAGGRQRTDENDEG